MKTKKQYQADYEYLTGIKTVMVEVLPLKE